MDRIGSRLKFKRFAGLQKPLTGRREMSHLPSWATHVNARLAQKNALRVGIVHVRGLATDIADDATGRPEHANGATVEKTDAVDVDIRANANTNAGAVPRARRDAVERASLLLAVQEKAQRSRTGTPWEDGFDGWACYRLSHCSNSSSSNSIVSYWLSSSFCSRVHYLARQP